MKFAPSTHRRTSSTTYMHRQASRCVDNRSTHDNVSTYILLRCFSPAGVNRLPPAHRQSERQWLGMGMVLSKPTPCGAGGSPLLLQTTNAHHFFRWYSCRILDNHLQVINYVSPECQKNSSSVGGVCYTSWQACARASHFLTPRIWNVIVPIAHISARFWVTSVTELKDEERTLGTLGWK